MRGHIGTSTSAAQRPLKPKEWTSEELAQVEYFLKKGLSNMAISNNLKNKTSRDVADLLSRESVFQ